MEVIVAIVFLKGLVKVIRYHVEVSSCGWESWLNIVSPVCCTIAHHITSQVDVLQSWIELSLEVILVDLPRKIGHVDSTVALTGYEKLVVLEFWEFNIPSLEGSERVLGLDHIVG